MSTARTVLIIDDQQDLLKSIARVLKLDDYEVESSGSLAETLARSRWDHFDVILLDRKLLDGLAEDLLPRLNELAPQASVVIATGYADLESSIQAMRFGAEDYLVKPVHPDVLRQTLARIMRVKEAEQKVIESERLAMVGQMMAVLAHESGNALARAQ